MTDLHRHPVPPRASRFRQRRQRLLVGCAFGAASLFMGHADRASAQAFQLNDANATVAAGNAILSRDSVSTPGTETITVNSPTAIINWNRAETDFLPENNIATFQNGSGTTNFVVLNRVLGLNPGAVEFNGTVQSQINGTPGGTLIFQSDGGIIVGSTAVFDVGNLVLTTLPVIDETGYGDIVNDGGGFDFGFASQFDSEIVTEPNAQINATASGSYVAMVAPRINHGGITRVNGSAVYIGARSASFSVNAGLFDIVVDSGSSLDTPIEHSGTTTGPASTDAATDPHRIYMVTAPSFSSDPIRILVSGDVGFDDAVSATVENGQIVLSAGFDVENGQIVDTVDRNNPFSYKYSESNIEITGGSFTSDVIGRATSNATARSDSGALSFSGDLTLIAYGNAQLGATSAGVEVDGDVNLTSLGPLEFGYGGSSALAPFALDVTGGEAAITAADGQSVVISGDATLEASAVGDFDNADDLEAGFGEGGATLVEVDSTGGQITFEGNLAMNATGRGAADARVSNTGGDGLGGSATIRSLAGEIVVEGGVAIDVRGTGTGGVNSAGVGSGGNVSIAAAGGNVEIAGATSIDTRGTGGAILGTPAAGTVGGAGSGGFVSVSADGGDTVRFGTSTTIDTQGLGGNGAVGGAGTGGAVSVSGGFISSGTGGQVITGDTFGVDADGTGGAGAAGNGGAGTGGNVTLSSQGAGGAVRGATVTISSNGTGGAAGIGDSPTTGGAGQGGSISLVGKTDSGAIELGNVSASSLGTGGAGAVDGGAGTGGTIFAGTEVGYGSTGVSSNATFGNLDLRANGAGGAGARAGGAGTGGSARIEAQAGPVSFGGASNLSARGIGGTAGALTGGTGQGGTAAIRTATGQTMLASAGTTTIDASGVGGTGGATLGTGGLGRGGVASIEAAGGVMTLNGSVQIRADGTGGASSPGDPPVGIGGEGQGGQVAVRAQSDGEIRIGSATLSAQGRGGAGSVGNPSNGGGATIQAGTGSSIQIVDSLSVDVSGTGGRSYRPSVASSVWGTGGGIFISAFGGDIDVGGASVFLARGIGAAIEEALSSDIVGARGQGGLFSISASDGAVALGTSTSVDVSGQGGSAPTGGEGLGGQVFINAFQNGTASLGAATEIVADGLGGLGELLDGGAGTGGTIQITAEGPNSVANGGALTFDFSASGVGGAAAQDGGVGTGGQIRIVARADGGSVSLGSGSANSSGVGGIGGEAGGLGEGGDIFAGTELGYGGTASATLGNASFIAVGVGGIGGDQGGAGNGGTAQIQAAVGQVAIGGNSNLVASGSGGEGLGTASSGGAGTGGTAGILAASGTTVTGSAGGILITSAGAGGDGAGSGGAGTGGNSYFSADGGDIALAGNVTVRADGTGGDGSGAVGGSAGTGGLARIAAFNGGEVSFAQATVTSDGRGGIGVVGGVGRAGNSVDPTEEVETGAFIVAENGTITGDSATVSAQGFGGDSIGAGDPLAGGSDGGDGFGGTAQIVALNADGPSVVDLGAASLDISAVGGDGATSYSGGDAAAGRTGAVLAETLGNSVAVDNLVFNANARGGNSGDAFDSLIGNGGNATAGFITIGTASGPGTGTTAGNATFGTIQANASATGGSGIANGSNGGNGEGGAIALLARGGTLETGDVTFVANGTGGNGGAGASGGTGTGGQAVALLTARDGTTDGADVAVGAFSATSAGAGGTGGTAGASQYGNVFVDVRGSTAVFASIDLTTAGSSAPSDPSLAAPILVSVENGALAVTGLLEVRSATAVDMVATDGTIGAGSATIVAPQDIAISTTGTGGFSGGAWSLDAGGDISVTDASFAANAPTIDVASFTASAGGNFVADSNTVVRASGSMLIAATGTATVSGSLSGGTIAVRGADIDLAAADGAAIDLDAADTLVAGDLAASGDITFAAGGAASFDNVDAGGRFAGSAATLTLPDATAAVIDISAASGTADLGALAGATSLTVNAAGDVTFNSLTGGDIAIASSGGGIAGGSADGATVVFDAAQTAAFTGTIVGNEIRVTSRDIDIGGAARIGSAATELVQLDVRQGGQQAVIGGGTQGPGYTLTNAEAGRIRTATLEISARQTGNAANRPADLVVRDLSLTGTPTPTGSGVGNLQISLTAGEGGGGGILSVEGALALANAGAGNGVTLVAPGGRIQIVNPQGSIRVLGANGLPGGNLEIEAANIWSASRTIIDQLVANPDFAGRNAALLASDGAAAPRGYIEGGEILLRVGDTLFVQNSGTAEEYAGITVVQNTLTIQPTSSDQIDVYAFGRRINADGTFVVNSPYFREVEFGARSAYLAAAQFNECTIATGVCSGDVPPGLPVGSEVIEGPIEETEDSVPPPNPDRQEFVDVSFATESLLEEPVTSGGDSGVWDGEDGDCPPGEVCEPGGGGN